MIVRMTVVTGLLLLSVVLCLAEQHISKEALLEKTRHWKEPKVAIWYYMGSSEGRDFFRYYDLGISETYSVESGQISLPKNFPFSKRQNQWIIMRWGPAALLP